MKMRPLLLRSPLIVFAALCETSTAFQQQSCNTSWSSFKSASISPRFDTSVGIFNKIGEFFDELDAFVDDATARRLGNGSAFYGKRKSSFYGKEDKGKKADKNIPDPLGERLISDSNLAVIVILLLFQHSVFFDFQQH
jgi:hypothetical protein